MTAHSPSPPIPPCSTEKYLLPHPERLDLYKIRPLDRRRPILWLASSKIIDPPHRPASVVTPRLWCNCVPFVVGGGHTRWVERGVGGQYFGRRQSLLYVFKYFVAHPLPLTNNLQVGSASV